ncbi:MAG: hypothetical protein K0S53_1882 [Bacteroidetes bacterium]|jgi:hypothetical protein|nr:hypothetical protein [Bacteroidota bacterium]MDF2450936.1 hypothetical protein [Bacteroidota bacterium]
MIRISSKLKKTLLIVIITIISLVALVIVFISPIAKYLVEKYDVKYIGREVKMDWAYVNPFTGYIHFDDFKIYEQKSDTVFIEIEGVSARVSMRKLLNKTYEINSLILNKPIAKVIQKKKVFNFQDIIDLFTPKDKPKTDKGPVHFNLLNAEINEGTFYFSEPSTPINYSIIHVNFKTAGKRWDNDTINGQITLQSGIGRGDLDGNFSINTKNQDYRFGVKVKHFDMKIMKQYLRDLSNYGHISSVLDADLQGKGNFKSKESIDGKGRLVISDFHFGKDSTEDYVAYEKLTLKITELAPAKRKYFFDTVRLEKPYVKYERYDYLDNIQRMFGKSGAKVKEIKSNPEKFNLIIELSKYIRDLFKNFLKSDYKINNLSVEEGDILYNDYSINEKFTASLKPLTIRADSVDNNNRWVKLTLESGVKPYGSLNIAVSMNPENNEDFDMRYKIHNIPAPLLNPYLVTFTSFPLDRGIIELSGNWNIRNNIIQSDNHFIMVDPRLADKVKKNGARWIPMPLIMAFVRERGNVIDYKIPITGNLKDPRFHVKDVLLDLLKNIFVKPPTTGYGFEVRNTETKVEKLMAITWDLRQAKLDDDQDKFLNNLAQFLGKSPVAHINFQPFEFTEKEKEYILFYEAKKKFYLANDGKKGSQISEEDSINIEKISVKDSAFILYVSKHVKDSMIFTMQEKCYLMVGKSFVSNKLKQLEKSRKETITAYFKQNYVDKQVHFLEKKTVIPRNGFTYYKITYKGEIPADLKEAYDKLMEIDSEPPREKYFKFRHRKNKS